MDATPRAAAARGIALFLGGFTLLNAIAGLGRRYFDANAWWIDLRPLPTALAFVLLCGGGAALLALGAWPSAGIVRRRISLGFILLLATAAFINCIVFVVLLTKQEIHSDFPLPFSLLILAALFFVGRTFLRSSSKTRKPVQRGLEEPDRASENPVGKPSAHSLMIGAILAACVIIFPLAQMFCFGLTDYRRRADAIVVFGAKANADGQPSDALADRVRKAAELYHEGYAPLLLFSGGPGEGAVHETESMRRFAIALGVPDGAILCDLNGLTTANTVADTVPMLNGLGARRVIVVSHFYHLPRIKLSYARAGLDVFTVPADQSHLLKHLPILMAREVLGLCEYYADPLLPKGWRMRS